MMIKGYRRIRPNEVLEVGTKVYIRKKSNESHYLKQKSFGVVEESHYDFNNGLLNVRGVPNNISLVNQMDSLSQLVFPSSLLVKDGE